MSVKLNVGDTVCVQKMGDGKAGKWVLATKMNDEGKDKIQIWADNASSIPDGVVGCEVVAITGVTKTAHEYPKGSGKWYPDTQVSATLKPIGDVGANPFDMPSGFEKINNEDIPF